MKTINKITWILMICPLLSVSQVLEPLQDQPEDIINGAYSKDHNQEKEEAYEYPEISEKDIVWSRTIWREIDLRQKINHHFYYPAIEIRSNLNTDKMSLIDVIMEEIQYGENSRCFNVVNNMVPGNEFKYGVITEEEEMLLGTSTQKGEAIQSIWGGGDSVDMGKTVYYKDIITPFKRTEVTKWVVKEEWFFDKQRW